MFFYGWNFIILVKKDGIRGMEFGQLIVFGFVQGWYSFVYWKGLGLIFRIAQFQQEEGLYIFQFLIGLDFDFVKVQERWD